MLVKLPAEHILAKNKKDHSTLVRMQKKLFKARYLNLILPITSNFNLRRPDIREGIYLADDVLALAHFLI